MKMKINNCSKILFTFGYLTIEKSLFSIEALISLPSRYFCRDGSFLLIHNYE